MKLLLLLFTLLLSVSLFAQDAKPNVVELRPGVRFFLPNKPMVMPLNDTGKVKTITAYIDVIKPGVYHLRQDGMACVVPDTKDLAIIPNAFKGEVKVPFVPARPSIPNAVTPNVLRPNDTK